MVTILSVDQQQSIVLSYREGLTLRQLAQNFCVSTGTVKRVLEQHRVPIRSTGRRVKYVTDRVCTLCRVEKPIDEFARERRRPTGFGYVCKECHRKKAKKISIKTKFGISLDEFKEIERAQNGNCAICGKKESKKRNGRPVRLSVDHDHATGIIRGLLCTRCNTAIGLFEENPRFLRQAVEYLQRHTADKALK